MRLLPNPRSYRLRGYHPLRRSARHSTTAHSGIAVIRAAARWLTVVDPDKDLIARMQSFRLALASVPRVRARLDLQ